MNDDFLYKFRKPPRREFAAALYQRISKPMKTPSRTPALRFITLAVSIVAVLTAVLFFSPSTRALADSIIRQIGGYIFVQAAPTDFDAAKRKLAQQELAAGPDQKSASQGDKQQLNEQVKKPEAKTEVSASFAQDAAEASQLAGFAVLAPAYLPDGFIIGSIKNISGGWAVFQQNGSMTASISYQNQAAQSFLTIEELQYQPDELRTVERPEIQDVTVRGVPGVWLPEPDGSGKNVLTWEENGIAYSVVSNTLSLDELLKIAESLGK